MLKIVNEKFGVTFQYAICEVFSLENSFEESRIDKNILDIIKKSNIIFDIFKNISKPIKFLTTSKEFTGKYIKKCPHNFLLENGKTFSIKTSNNKNGKFAPKVVGQSSYDILNYYFGDLYESEINRENFKNFCFYNINKILPILIDYSLVSDYNCLLYYDKKFNFNFNVIERSNIPDFTFLYKDFSFSNSLDKWNESITVKYKEKSLLEIQLHKEREYKFRFARKEFINLIKVEKKINNSLLGDTAELAICNIFNLDPGNDNDRLINNSDENILKEFEIHYLENKEELFPLKPIKYSGTEKRKRGGKSKSGIDFYLEGDKSLSLKTNKSKSFKVCPPEIGQPSPKTFDLYFEKKGWYEGKMNENKFRKLIKNKKILVLLLKKYVEFLNECDYLLWSLYLDNKGIESKLITKKILEGISFDSEKISYSNAFIETSSVTIKYGEKKLSLGEFQVHSARNSLKFRFNFGNLLKITNFI